MAKANDEQLGKAIMLLLNAVRKDTSELEHLSCSD